MAEHERMIQGEAETREEAIERMDRADSEPDPDIEEATREEQDDGND